MNSNPIIFLAAILNIGYFSFNSSAPLWSRIQDVLENIISEKYLTNGSLPSKFAQRKKGKNHSKANFLSDEQIFVRDLIHHQPLYREGSRDSDWSLKFPKDEFKWVKTCSLLSSHWLREMPWYWISKRWI